MNRTLYIIWGIASLSFGIYYTLKQIKVFMKNEQDELGWDIKGLGGGIGFILIGIFILIEYI